MGCSTATTGSSTSTLHSPHTPSNISHSWLTPFFSHKKSIIIFLALCITVASSHKLSEFGIPVPSLLIGMLIGIVISLTSKVPVNFSPQTSSLTSAFVGVLLGTYLNRSELQHMGLHTLYVVLTACSTIFFGLILAKIMVHKGQLDPRTAVLGLLPGGSAAAISAAKEIDASTEIVGFMQYMRVLAVTATAPVIFHLIDHSTHSPPSAPVPVPEVSFIRIVEGDDQFAGLCILLVLAIFGARMGKKLRIPSASLLGPMILSTLVMLFVHTQNYAPAGLVKEVIFSMVGLEVGLKFSRTSIKLTYKLLPVIMANILILCTISGVMAFSLAKTLHLAPSDLYLATTPGGINVIMGIASSSQTDLTLITTAQSLRLIFSLLILPFLVKLANHSSKKYKKQHAHTQVSSLPETFYAPAHVHPKNTGSTCSTIP